MRIGLDIDGVLADFEAHFLNYLDFDDKSPASDWYDSRFRDNFHKITEDEEFWLTMPEIITAEHLDNIGIKPSCYITARPISSKITALWLSSKRFPDAPLFTVGVDGSKTALAQEYCDVFIDDAIHNYEELTQAGVKCLLKTRSHNLGYNTSDRIDDLECVMETIKTNF